MHARWSRENKLVGRGSCAGRRCGSWKERERIEGECDTLSTCPLLAGNYFIAASLRVEVEKVEGDLYCSPGFHLVSWMKWGYIYVCVCVNTYISPRLASRLGF